MSPFKILPTHFKSCVWIDKINFPLFCASYSTGDSANRKRHTIKRCVLSLDKWEDKIAINRIECTQLEMIAKRMQQNDFSSLMNISNSKLVGADMVEGFEALACMTCAGALSRYASREFGSQPVTPREISIL